MARKSQKVVGIIGLGIIGSRVAAVLRSKGFHVCVWNRTPLPEPSFLGSPAEVAAVCDVIQIFVVDGDALLGILKAFGDSLSERHTIICNATIGPDATRQAAAIVAQAGARFLDAPFTGSKMAAEKGALVYYIGGDDEVLARVEPILAASSKAIVKAGAIGDAATLKIATNMMVGVTVQGLAEAAALVRASGIPPERLIDALEHHGVRSGITDMKLANMIQGDFSPHFSVKNMFKDLKIGMNMANKLDLSLPTTSVTTGLLYGLMERGDKDLDFSALMTLYGTTPQPELEQAQQPPVETPVAPPRPSPEKLPTPEVPMEAKASSASALVKKEGNPPKPPEEPAKTEPKILEAEVVSQSSAPAPKPEPAPASTARPVSKKLRKWFGR